MFLKNEPVSPAELSTIISKFNNAKSTARRKNFQKRIDYYFDKQLTYLSNALTKQFKNPKKLNLQPEFDNITSLIIDDLSVIYTQEPIRKILNGKPSDEKIYNQIIQDGKLNLIMAEANKMAKLCKTVMIKVVWRDNKIQFDIITPNLFEPIQDPNDITKAIGFVYISIIDDQNENLLNKDDTTTDKDPFLNASINYNYWSINKNIIFKPARNKSVQIEEIKSNKENLNPYKILPVVMIYDGIAISDFFIEGGDDLINTNEIINVKITELNYLTKMQSFSIPVRKGADNAGQEIFLDPSQIIDIPADSDIHKGQDFKFVSPEAKIKELEDSIDKKKRRIAIKYKLDPDLLIDSAQKSSAQAMQLKALQRSGLIAKDRPFYRNYEQDLFNVIRTIFNYHSESEKISESAILQVDFIESEIPMTISERDQHNLLMFNNGLMSRERWVMSENPDIQTEEEARKLLDEISAQRKADIDFLENNTSTDDEPDDDNEDQSQE